MESKEENSIIPQNLVTDEAVRNILLADKGWEAKLLSWDVDHFTKTGDNYASSVIGVKVRYSLGEEINDSFYVAKVNPCRPNDTFDDMNQLMFTKESAFYLNILPELNGILLAAGQPPLNFAKCFYSSLERLKEQIYFEDLRKRGFRLLGSTKGLDIPHVTLVMKELARLHATSLLLQSEYSEPIEVKHEILMEDVFSTDKYFDKIVGPMLLDNISNSINLLEVIGGYDKAVAWIKHLKAQLKNIFKNQMKSKRYNVLCHGDCWTNNLMFRYATDGSPVEVMLVDLQICREASPAIDLNDLMYTSLSSDIRRSNVKDLLHTYYNSFHEVVSSGGMTMPFSEEEILKEFRSKNHFGALFGMFSLPVILMEDEELKDMEKHKGDFTKISQEVNSKLKEALQKKPEMKERFLGIFEELMDIGIIQ